MASPASQQESSDNSKLAQGSDGQEEALNPMQMDEILDKVFGYCALKDLASCRRASKQWFNVSLSHWLDKAPMLKLRLDPEGDFKDDKGTMSVFLHSTRNEFHEYGDYEFRGLRKYMKFEIVGSTTENPVHHLMLQQFLPKCGGWITDMKLYLKFSDWDTYQTVMLSRFTPNLVNLDAHYVGFSDGFDQQQEKDGVYEVKPERQEKLKSLKFLFDFQNFPDGGLPVVGWIQLLQRYPNLKTIIHYFGEDEENYRRNIDRMLEAIWSIRQEDRKLLDLKCFEICYDDHGDMLNSNSLLPFLRNTGLALETFRAAIGEETSNQRIYEVLDAQASTLKKLTLYSVDRFVRRELEFQPPEMKLVETLVVKGDLFDNFAFLKCFPTLKSLTLGKGATYDHLLQLSTEKHLEGVVIPTLETLHSDYKYLATFLRFTLCGNRFIRFDRIPMLSWVMPNLKDIQVCVDNEAFREVCKCWPRLEHLTLVGDSVDDEGITGIIDGEEQRREFNITTLQGLRSLTMTNFDHLNSEEEYLASTAITQKSFPAILALPHLEKLDITMNKKLCVDKNVIDTLTSKIKSCSITFARRSSSRDYEEREASERNENVQQEGNDDREGGINGTSDDGDGCSVDSDSNDGGADADTADNGVDGGSHN